MISSEWVLVIVTAVLAGITGFYAKRTAQIAKLTKQQADASIKMAEEMREQRYYESLPLLIPTVIPIVDPFSRQDCAPNEVQYLFLQTGLKTNWVNQGRGLAINVRLSFWPAPLDDAPRKAFYIESEAIGCFEIGKPREVGFFRGLNLNMFDLPEGYRPRLEAEYQDIYERKITTVQEFRVQERNGTKSAFLADLYFTVNGKRLGRT